MKSDVFSKELSYIKNTKHLDNAIKIIEMLPDYFFEIPASSTGKHHPAFSLGPGGLVRHTKVAVRIAYELLENESIGSSFTDDEKDLIIIALLIHDGMKMGKEKTTYTLFDHPLFISNMLEETRKELTFTDDELKLLISMTESHMGQWNTSEYSDEVLPKPNNKYERFVHMCDYLSSKRYLDVKFDSLGNIDDYSDNPKVK